MILKDLFDNTSSNQDRASLIAAIQSVRYRGGSTATYDGLRYARAYHFASYHGGRPDANRLVIVMTDGRSNDVSRTIHEAGLLKVTEKIIVTPFCQN